MDCFSPFFGLNSFFSKLPYQMKYTQYISLIKRLEDVAAKNPQGYERRVIGLAVLGYAYFVGIIIIFLAIPILIIASVWFFPAMFWVFIKGALKIIWLIVIGIGAFLGFLGNAIRSLWTKVPEPEGIELTRANAPEVFQISEKISRELKAPFPDKILLTEDYNAAVMTLPRFGMFGKKTFLIAGLPLMQAISPEQFEAVVAHEFGHISRRHSKYAAWIYRLHETWKRFLNSQEQQEHKLSFLYSKFVDWYFPYFSAYSFVLMRRQEREADEYAVQLCGAKPLGEALINSEIKGIDLAQNFWQKILDEAAHESAPPKKVFSRMALAFREGDASHDHLHLAKAVAVRTDYQDSHPALSERLKAIGYWKNDKDDLPNLPAPVTQSAADKFLGETASKVAGLFDESWQKRVEQDWKARHDYLAQVQKRLDELAKKQETEPLTTDELYERAGLTAEKFGEKQALPLVREIVEKFPDDANSNFTYGAFLLNEGEENGIEYIEKAKKLDSTLKIRADELIYNFLRSKGRDEQAHKYLESVENAYEAVELAQRERASVLPEDNFESPSLPPEQIEKIRRVLGFNEEIQAAYLVRKSVRHLPEFPFHVLCLDIKMPRFKFGGVSSENVLEAVSNQVGNFDVNFVIVLEKNYKGLERKIGNISGAKIYQK